MEPTPEQLLVARLRRLVRKYCERDDRVFTCDFVPGGKKQGRDIAGPQWCRTCGHEQMWHDVGRAAAIVDANRPITLLDLVDAPESVAS